MYAGTKWLAWICTLVVAGFAGMAFAQSTISSAPVNPAFLQSQHVAQPRLAGDAAGATPALGYRPSPLDRSHMIGQRPLDAAAKSLQSAGNVVYPASFDLRTLGYVSSVKNQGACGDCWSFSTIASVESNILAAGGGTFDFSENHQNVRHGFDAAPCNGGSGDLAGAYMTRWGNTDSMAAGLVYEADDPYTSTAATSVSGLSPRVHVQEILVLPDRAGGTDNDNYKYALMNYGAVDIAIYADSGMAGSTSSAYWNQASKAYYYNGSATQNHEVALVGWDDNYPAANFRTAPPGNGAFIVKNSWGSSWGNGGYFYMSYYDSRLADAHVFRPPQGIANYARAYLYDPFGNTTSLGYGTTTAWGANVFTAVAGETLQAVAFNTGSVNGAYEISIYTGVTGGPASGTLEGGSVNTTGSFPFAGYHTVTLARPVALTAGQKFAVVIKFTTPGYNYPLPLEYPFSGYDSAATASAGQSYISSSGASWTDLTSVYANTNVNIRAYTGGGGLLAQTLSISAPASVTFSEGGTFQAGAASSAGLTPVSITASGACSGSGAGTATIAIAGAGTCTLNASQGGDATHASAAATVTVAIAKASQTIAFTPASPVTFALNGSYALSATSSAGLAPIVFGSTSLSICSVSGAVATMLSAGTCQLTASQAGNANYNAASAAASVSQVALIGQTIVFGSAPNVAAGGTGTVSASGGGSGNPVVFASATPAICGIAGSTVSGLQAGTCTITADQAGNAYYAPAPTASLSFAIGPSAAEAFPRGGVFPAGWVQPPGSDAGWMVAADAAYSGTLSLKSGVVLDGQVAAVSVSARFAAGTVSFARKVSSEANHDWLEFYVDGVLRDRWSGEAGWAVVSYALGAGQHTLMWRYVKDAGLAAGSDAAWIDDVALPPAAARSLEPALMLLLD